jgi:hypothetical protein
MNAQQSYFYPSFDPKSWDITPYLKEFNLPTPSLMPEGRSRRRSKGRRSIIIDDAISIDKGHKKMATKP